MLELQWMRARKPPIGKLADRALYALRMERPCFVGDTQYLIDSAQLGTWIRRGRGWKRLPSSTGSDGKVLKLSVREDARVVVGERVVAVSGDGEIVELASGRWTVRHQPAQPLPLHGAYVGWDAARERLVAWHGGTIDEASRDRYKKLTTWLFENKQWRQSAIAPPAPNKDWAAPFLFFDAALGRIVRMWEHDLAVLDGDTWHSFKPAGFDYAAIYTDSKTGETLAVCNDVAYRFDVRRWHAVAKIALVERSATGEGIAWCYHERARRLVEEDRGDPKLTFVLDLSAAFTAAAKLGPRKPL
jgi:hypothetical protein